MHNTVLNINGLQLNLIFLIQGVNQFLMTKISTTFCNKNRIALQNRVTLKIQTNRHFFSCLIDSCRYAIDNCVTIFYSTKQDRVRPYTLLMCELKTTRDINLIQTILHMQLWQWLYYSREIAIVRRDFHARLHTTETDTIVIGRQRGQGASINGVWSEMTPKQQTLECKNQTLGEDRGSKIIKNGRTSFMDDPLVHSKAFGV